MENWNRTFKKRVVKKETQDFRNYCRNVKERLCSSALCIAYAYDFGLSEPDYVYRPYACKKTCTQLGNIINLTWLYNNNSIG